MLQVVVPDDFLLVLNMKSSTLMASKYSNCNSVLASSDDIKQIADNFKH